MTYLLLLLQVCVSQLLYVPDNYRAIAAREQCGLFDINKCGTPELVKQQQTNDTAPGSAVSR